jgi:hypothetical protein
MNEVLVEGFYIFCAHKEFMGNGTIVYVRETDNGLVINGGRLRCKSNELSQFYGPISKEGFRHG